MEYEWTPTSRSGGPKHATALVEQLDAFAQDPVGRGQPLPQQIRDALVPRLRAFGGSGIPLAFQGERVIGAAICFRGFSTFKARPLLNLHDLTVRPEEQRQGLGRALLEAVEQRARELGCCKLTLEAHEDNRRARNLNAAFGFDGHHVGEGTKATFFIEKRL